MAGRPRGTFKYKHPETGQPIGVFEWRRLTHKKKQDTEELSLSVRPEIKRLFLMLCRLSDKPKEEIMAEALECYLKEKLKT